MDISRVHAGAYLQKWLPSFHGKCELRSSVVRNMTSLVAIFTKFLKISQNASARFIMESPKVVLFFPESHARFSTGRGMHLFIRNLYPWQKLLRPHFKYFKNFLGIYFESFFIPKMCKIQKAFFGSRVIDI